MLLGHPQPAQDRLDARAGPAALGRAHCIEAVETQRL